MQCTPFLLSQKSMRVVIVIVAMSMSICMSKIVS